jgi:phospholipid/cholesterol/gamma-HCH transport system substrate-binding protein
LTLDDPVKINGVKLGKVEIIHLYGHKVLVVVRIRNDVRIPVGSEIRVQNIGIMGERQIGMILCDSNVNYNPGDTIDGQFDAGIAEALGLAGEIIDSTKILITSVHRVMDSTIANPEFRERFRSMMDKAETLENRLSKMLSDTDPQLKKSLKNLNDATVKVNALLDTTQAPINGLLSDASNLMKDAGGVVGKLDAVTDRLTAITEKLQSKDNTAGILLNDRKLHDELVQTLHSADSLFQIILQDGLDINVDIF